MSNKINIHNARVEEQRMVMEQIQKDGVCPFCREHFETYHSKPILFETSHWLVTENAWPYENTQKHFLFVSQKHVTTPTALEKDAWEDLNKCVEQLEKEHEVTHGTLLMRFGGSETTGATVDHLHAQLVVAQSPDIPVITRVG